MDMKNIKVMASLLGKTALWQVLKLNLATLVPFGNPECLTSSYSKNTVEHNNKHCTDSAKVSLKAVLWMDYTKNSKSG